MKGFLSSLGWILLLGLAVVFLLLYNFGYSPKADKVVRLQNEIVMWTGQVQELAESLRAVRSQQETAFKASFTFDELFGGSDEFRLVPQAESAVRACVPALQGLPGRIEVVGHADRSGVPQRLRDRYPSAFEYAAARAGAVARLLVAWGVAPNRVLVLSAGGVPPAAGAVGGAVSRRVEIVVRKQ
jgi:outer membrane protein OmpA-like peptidoglycan-associated protein